MIYAQNYFCIFSVRFFLEILKTLKTRYILLPSKAEGNTEDLSKYIYWINYKIN